MAASRSSQRNAREFFELKQRAVQFYKENQVPEKLEEILNAMVYENPPDVYGRLSEYFETISKPPVISRVQAHHVLDSRGQQTLQADIHCIVRGIEKAYLFQSDSKLAKVGTAQGFTILAGKLFQQLASLSNVGNAGDELISSSTMSSYNHLADSATVDQKEAEDIERKESVSTAIEYILGPFNDALSGTDPFQQKEIDQVISSIINKMKELKEEKEAEQNKTQVEICDDAKSEVSKADTKLTSAKGKKKSGSAKSTTVIIQEPKEPMFCGCNAVCVVSQAVATTGASIQAVPLYEHIASLYQEEPPYQFSLPVPMVTVLSSGKAAPGKQNLIKELLLIPKPELPYSESLEKLLQIYHQVVKLQFSRVGVTAYYTNDFGAISPQYDRPDQLLDHVMEALLALGLTAGEDVFLGLNCAAHELYDPDKGKYEIMSGTLKTGEDMVEVYADIMARYPGVIALIDPLKKHEVVAWKKLCAQFSANCFILGDQAYPRPEKFLMMGFDNLELNGAVLKLQQMTSVTDLIKTAKMVHDQNCITTLAGVQGDTNDTFLADMAVGIQSTFVKFGAPNRGERVALYNRLGRIADQLASQGALVPRSEFPFCAIHQPEPEPNDDNTSQTQDDQSIGSGSKKGE